MMNEYDTPSNNINSASNEYPRKNKSKKGVLALLVIVMLLIVVAIILCLNNLKKPKNVFKELISQGFDYLESNIEENKYQSISGTLSLKINGTSDDDSNNEILKIINKIDFSSTYGIDYQNKIINLDLNSKYNNKELLKAKVYGENGKAYIYLEDLYDKYIESDVADYNNIFEGNTNLEDTKIILKSMKKSLDSALKDEYFTTEKATINNKQVDKMTLNLNKENLEKIKNDFINNLLKDNEFIESAAKINKKTTEEIEEVLNDSLEQEVAEDYDPLEISLYIDNTKLVSFELRDSETGLIITKNNDKYDYQLISEETTLKGSILVDQSEDHINLKISLSDQNNKNSLEITMTSSIKYNESISKLDTSNSIKTDKITDKELSEIYLKIMEQEGLLELAQDLNNYRTPLNYSNSNL